MKFFPGKGAGIEIICDKDKVYLYFFIFLYIFFIFYYLYIYVKIEISIWDVFTAKRNDQKNSIISKTDGPQNTIIKRWQC